MKPSHVETTVITSSGKGWGLLMRLSVACALCCLCTLAFAADPAHAAIRTDIPPEDLGSALQTLAQVHHVQLVYLSEKIDALKTPGAVGDLTADEALTRLLQGTGLSYKYLDGNTVTVFSSAPSGASAAAGQEQSQSSSNTIQGTEKKSSQDFSLAQSDQASAGPPAVANDQLQEKKKDKDEGLSEIIVTGTRIRGVSNDSSPTVTINRDDIDRTGYTTTGELMNSLPQNFGGFSFAGAFADGNRSIASTNIEGAQSVDLRGLGPGSTLVLLNGERRSGALSGQVNDISTIPLALLERVDIATGGRSSVYGTDAVGGVVNFVTRRDYDGALTEVRGGGARDGAGNIGFNQIYGMHFDTGGFVISYDYQHDNHFDAVRAGLTQPAADGTTYSALWVSPNSVKQSAYASGHWKPSDSVELLFDGLYSWKKIQGDTVSVSPEISNSQVYNPSTEQYNAAPGARIALGSWQLRPVVSFSGTNTINRSYSNQVFQGTPFVSSDVEGDRYAIEDGTVSADGPISGLPVRAAVGFEWRHERATSPTLATGRQVRSVFGEIDAPLIQQGEGDRHLLDLNISGRYDHYSDFGGTFNPSYGIAWSPVKDLKLRGSYSTSFRAPDIFTAAQPFQAYIFNFQDAVSPSGFSPTLFMQGTRPGLTPELARTWSAGWDYTQQWLTVSGSYYRINYRNRLDTPISGIVPALQDLPSTILTRNPSEAFAMGIVNSAMPFLNATTTPFNPATQAILSAFPGLVVLDDREANIEVERVSGIDFTANGKWNLNSGELRAAVNANYTLSHQRNLTASSPTESLLDQPGKPVNLRARADFGFSDRRWDADLFANYMNSYTNTLLAARPEIGSWITADASAAIKGESLSTSRILRGSALRLSVQNIFDRRPPILLGSSFGLTFDSANANPLGRFLSLTFSKRFGEK